MCGIFGFVDFNGGAVNKPKLAEIAQVLSRRGPDDEGLFVESANRRTIALVHRRLNVIDLQTGRQPIENESGEIVLICNGEIYNYKDLRKDLIARGHKFRTVSDSEVIVHAYEEFSFDCLDHLRGMFTFAIWDSKRAHLFIARDRIGKKPLYYHLKSDGKLVFASEIRALLKYGEVERTVNRRAINQYLSYCYIPAPNTAFNDIYKLNPGHYLLFSPDGIKTAKYWDIDFSDKISISENEAAEEIGRLVRESVRLRMISDVPVGAFLSGGLDSSIVVGLMSKETSLPIRTFSIGFEEAGYSELPYAGRTQRYFGCSHREIIMKAVDSFNRLPDLVELFGEPHADSSAMASMILSEEAKKAITVTLVGEGADELFAGYKRYQYFRLANYFTKIAPALTQMLHIRYKRWLGGIKPSLERNLFSKGFLGSNKDESSDSELFDLFTKAKNFPDIDKALYADTMFFLPYDLLVKLDTSSMAYGLEARAPFLEHKLIEFVARLSPFIKLKGFESKHILRKAFAGLLPSEILSRRKTAFAVPVNNWFRNELKDSARDVLLSSSAVARGYFNVKVVENLLNRHIKGDANYGNEIWTLLVLEIWHRKFVDLC